MARIIIIEDQTIMLEALKTLVEDTSDYKVVGTYNHPTKAIEAIEGGLNNVDVALIDIRLPEINGIELTEVIKKMLPKIKVILLTQYPNKEYVKAGIKHGANGYLLKSIEPKELINAISSVLDGKDYYCEKATKSILSFSDDEAMRMTLSPREKQVLVLIAKGKLVKEISNTLNITENTVNYYKKKLKEKLNLKKISDITRYAYESGLIDLGSL